jgi:hypothetical protein
MTMSTELTIRLECPACGHVTCKTLLELQRPQNIECQCGNVFNADTARYRRGADSLNELKKTVEWLRSEQGRAAGHRA